MHFGEACFACIRFHRFHLLQGTKGLRRQKFVVTCLATRRLQLSFEFMHGRSVQLLRVLSVRSKNMPHKTGLPQASPKEQIRGQTNRGKVTMYTHRFSWTGHVLKSEHTHRTYGNPQPFNKRITAKHYAMI